MSTMRNTIQRKLVLEAVQHLHNHPTADEIYQYVAESHPSISRGTVYRNLSLLAEQGEIQRISHLNAADRFDYDVTPHYHFKCTACNGVFDVALPYNFDMLQQVPNPDGFWFESYDITFSGLCPNCCTHCKTKQ